MVPESIDACETNVILVEGTNGYSKVSTSSNQASLRQLTANIGRIITGSIVGIL
jgi:hypothetical protein